MNIEPLGIEGAWKIELSPASDERGWFVRTYDRAALAAAGIDLPVEQSSVSFNTYRHTLRGMHLQRPPSEETKLIRCTRGAAFDVAVDLRQGSSTYCRWVGVTLTEDEPVAVVLPPGVAHGFLTLLDATEVSYDISTPYDAEAADGVRWNDPTFGIEWPAQPAVLSARDATLTDFRA